MASIEQTIQLNKLLEDQNKLIADQTKMFSQQLQMTKQIMEIQQKMTKSGSEQAREAQQLADTINEVAKNIDEMGSQQQAVFDTLMKNITSSSSGFREMADSIRGVSKWALVIAPIFAGFSGFARGIQLTTNAFTGMFSIAKGVAGVLFDIGASIVALPFKLFDAFLNLGIQGSTALREAFEAARKELGALGTNEGAATIQAFKNMRGELSETGLSVYRVFGDLAERMQWVNETAQNLGVTFSLVRNQFAQNVESIGAYIKGLGFSQEAQRAMAEESIRSGRSMIEIGRETTTMAFGMGKAFGINGKLISRDVGEMAADFANFGGLATSQLASVSVFARKLGVEIKGLLGVIGKFDNFEDAAQSAANLSQAFGLNVDALKMLQEQDPAARIEQLRKAFFAAGKSVETMTRQERALLAQHTGLDEKTASLVFSQQNQAMSYEDIQRQAELTEKKQLSQAEAMEKLAGSIERMIKQGDKMTKGFFATFADGFNIGIVRSKEFIKAWQSVQQSLRITRILGIDLGRSFMDSFPGIQKMFGSIRDFFKPSRVRGLIKPISDSIKSFFKGEVSFSQVFDKIKSQFKAFFSPSGKEVKGFISGATSFVKKLGEIFKEVGSFAVKHLTDGFKFIANWIKNGKMPDMEGAAGGVQAWFSDNIWNPLIKWLKSEEVTELKNALVDMLSVAWEKFKGWAVGFAKDNWKVLGAILLGPAAIGALTNFLVVGLGTVLVKGIGGALKGAASGSSSMISKGFGKIFSGPQIGKGIQQQVGDAVAESISSASKASEAASQSKISAGSVGKMAAIGLFLAVGMTAVIWGIFKVTEIIRENNFSLGELATATAVMGMAGAVMAEAAGVAALAALVGKAISGPAAAQAAVGLLAIEIVVAAMGLTAWAMIKAFSGLSSSEIQKTQKVMGIMGDLFLAASLVTGVAALVGTGIMATAGVGGAAIAVGMTTLAVAIGAMTVAAIAVIKSVGNVNVGPDAEMKMNLFKTVIETIGNFAKDFGAIAKAVSPNIVESIFGASTTEKNISALAGLMAQLGNTLAGEGGLIPTIIKATEGVTQEQINKASGLANIISSIVGVVDVVGKQMERLKDNSVSGFLFGRGVSGELMDKMKDFFGTTLRGVAKSMKSSVEILASFSVDPNKAKGIKTMTDIVWSMVKSLEGMTPEKIDKMNELVPRIPSVIENMANAITMIEAPVAQIKDETVERVRTSVTAMIQSINEISKGIRGLGKVNIASELKILNDRLGLGSNRRLTIDKGDLKIQINVGVKLDIEEFEEALSTRPGGARFNLSANNPFRGGR